MKRIISVIIPVFNSEAFLADCLESIRKQRFKNFEVILIDDGSTDNSRKICYEFSSLDSRFRTYYQPNRGPSAARNKGIEKAVGKYIVFVDSDDRVLNNYLDSLCYSDFIKPGTLVIGDLIIEKEGEIIEHMSSKEYYIDDLIGEEKKIDYLLAGPPVAKLLERQILIENKIRFNESISTNEDHIFHLEYLLFVKSVKKVSGIGYIYVHRNVESLSTKRISYEELYLGIAIIDELSKKVIEKFQIKDLELINSLYQCYIDRIYASIYSLYQPPYYKKNPERLKLLAQIIKNHSSEMDQFKSSTETFKKLIMMMLMIKNIWLADIILYLIFKMKNNLMQRK